MALAFLVSPYLTMASGRPDDLQKEWQECRTVIGRMDNTLLDLRKYGFGLAAGLLTANGVLGGVANLLPKPTEQATASAPPPPGFTVPSDAIAALVTVTMALVVALFIADRYYSVLQWGAVRKAEAIEGCLQLGLTGAMHRSAESNWVWGIVAVVQYLGFILVAATLGIAVIGWNKAFSLKSSVVVIWIATVVSAAIVVVLYFVAKSEWDRMRRERPMVLQRVTSVPVQPAAVQRVEAGKTFRQQLTVPTAGGVLGVVKPTGPLGLSIIGCRVLDQNGIEVTFSNETDAPIDLPIENYEVFVGT